MKKIYYPIVFMQGEEAEEVLDMLDEYGEREVLEHLMQWETGDEEPEDENPAGRYDHTFVETVGGHKYVMNYNTGLPYFGLCRVETKKES